MFAMPFPHPNSYTNERHKKRNQERRRPSLHHRNRSAVKIGQPTVSLEGDEDAPLEHLLDLRLRLLQLVIRCFHHFYFKVI